MFIMMLQTRCGSEDGMVVRCFEAGTHYEIAENLARAFLREGSARRVAKRQIRKRKQEAL